MPRDAAEKYALPPPETGLPRAVTGASRFTIATSVD